MKLSELDVVNILLQKRRLRTQLEGKAFICCADDIYGFVMNNVISEIFTSFW